MKLLAQFTWQQTLIAVLTYLLSKHCAERSEAF